MQIQTTKFEFNSESMSDEQCRSLIEKCARLCYKSEDKISDDSDKKLINLLIKNNHEAMLEHSFISVKIICDRAVSHELVRHRHFSFAQESQRYCNYSKDKFNNQITFMQPTQFDYGTKEYFLWQDSMENQEKTYFEMLKYTTPENARSGLPNSTKTEIMVSGNIRQFRLFFKLRASKNAHPDMRYLATNMLKEFKLRYPIFFNDIGGN